MLRKSLTYCSTNIKVKSIKAVSYVGLRFAKDFIQFQSYVHACLENVVRNS